MTTDNTYAFYYGCPVNIAAGVLTAIQATPTTTKNGYTPVGIFVGCEYNDPAFGRVFRNYLPASAVTAGYTGIKCFVEDSPGLIMQVQASGTIAYTAVGKNAELTNFSGSTTTGDSAIKLLYSTINTTSTFAVKIIDLVNPTSSVGLPSAPGDTYTDCIVIWNAGVHQYSNATGA
jgi:hypothetical protein